MEQKQLDGYFKRQADKNSFKKTWTWLRKGNLKRKTETLLIAARNDAIRTHSVKAKIDKMQQNSKRTLHCDIDETINHILSE